MMTIQNLPTYLFAEVANAYRTAFEKVLTEIGLHSGQVFVLDALFEIDGASQKELADRLNLSAPTVNNMVKKLVENGFVECARCEQDGRSMRVYLTPKSLSKQGLIAQKWREFDDRFLSSLTATEKLMFSQLLEKVRMDLQK